MEAAEEDLGVVALGDLAEAAEGVAAQEVVVREAAAREAAGLEDVPRILGAAASVIRAETLAAAGAKEAAPARVEAAGEEPERLSAEEAIGKGTDPGKGEAIGKTISASARRAARIRAKKCRVLARRTSEIWWVK